MTIATKTMNNENELVSIFDGRELELQCVQVCGIDTIKGINFSAMNNSENFLPYCKLILQAEKERNEKRIEKLEEKLSELVDIIDEKHLDLFTLELEESKELLKEKKTLEYRQEEIKPVLDSLQELKPENTALAATWAFSHSTPTFGNDETVPNYGKIKDCAKTLHSLVKAHAEEVYSFAGGVDKNGQAIANSAACHGQVYKKVKETLSELFSLLYGQGIRANQADVAWIVHACVSTTGGVNKENSNAKQAKFSIKQENNCLKEVCSLLCSKLADRQRDNVNGAEKTDGTDKIMPISE